MCIDSVANNFVQSLSGADGYVTGEQADTQVRGARLEKQQEMKQNQQARALEKTLCLFRFGRVFLALTLTRPLATNPTQTFWVTRDKCDLYSYICMFVCILKERDAQMSETKSVKAKKKKENK